MMARSPELSVWAVMSGLGCVVRRTHEGDTLDINREQATPTKALKSFTLLKNIQVIQQMLVDYLILSDRTPAQMFAPEVVVR